MNILNIIITLLAVLLATTRAMDEDFAFDIPEGINAQKHFPDSGNTEHTLGEIMALVGRPFHYQIPKDVFDEQVLKFEAKIDGIGHLPSWILFERMSGIFWGIPTEEDVGDYRVIVKGFSRDTVTSKEFSLSIKDIEDHDSHNECGTAEKKTVLKLCIAKDIKSINPKHRIMSIVNIAKFFGLPESAFTIKSIMHPEDIGDNSVVIAGPGALKTRHLKPLSDIEAIVGCNGHIWEKASSLVNYLKIQASDGTIAEVLGLPLVGWHVKVEKMGSTRNKRDIESSGDDLDNSGDGDQYYNYEDYDYSDNEDYEENKSATSTSTTTTKQALTSTTQPSSTEIEVTETHPHRHHHGETQIPTTVTITSTITPKDDTISTSTVTTTIKEVTTSTTTKNTVLIDNNNDDEDNYDDYDDFEPVTVIPSTSVNTEGRSKIETMQREVITKLQTVKTDTDLEVITEATQFVTNILTDTTIQPTAKSESTGTTPISTVIYSISSTETAIPLTTPSTTISTEPSVVETEITTEAPHSTLEVNETTYEEVTVVKQTTVRHISSTMAPTPRITTETVIYEVKNFPPTLQNRLNKVAATAGKIFSFIIPNDTFSDVEDGNDLRLEFLDSENREIKKSTWCQFNPITREVYGLPMEIDVSRWTFTIKATDSEGASVADTFEILVQHHKSKRAVNHEFSLYVQIEKKTEFPHLIDWPLKILHALKEIYHLPNLTEITVRNVDYQSVPAVFAWTNDSLPKYFCPKEELETLFKVLTVNNEGDPTHTLIRLLAPELRVKKVAYKGLGVCEPKPQTPITPPTNFSPILRNPVDHIDATVGKLLVYKVPEDTFYDPEDTDPRNLRMNLLLADRQPIPVDNWLQFDEKNKEFYGVPFPNHVGSKEYHLLCKDSGGLSASDSLVVQVHPMEKPKYNVEFKMSLLTDEKFVHSASLKRKFIEKIQELFGDKNTNHIQLKSITMQTEVTFVSWYNSSLVLDVCPRAEIHRLGTILVNSDRTIASRVQYIMDSDFPVSSIQMEDLGSCKKKLVDVPVDRSRPIPASEETPSSANHDEYLVTFIVPAIIIAAMLLLAGIFACVLYRRRRTGKMNVDEDGRATYGNKGIPVIFQEELEEKPESGTKTPIILKDEKPPLAPPEYSKSGSLKLTDDSEPYQPPPPMARMQENGRQPRPKPTPTYRKPPPYVPP